MEIIVEEPSHHRRVERYRARNLSIGPGVEVIACDWVDEYLIYRLLYRLVTCANAYIRSHVSTGRLAYYRDERRISVQIRSIVERPSVRSVHVVVRGRKAMLGAVSILGRDDDAMCGGADGTSGTVVRIDVRDYPSAAVNVERDGKNFAFE